MGLTDHPVAHLGLKPLILVDSVRPDGSWADRYESGDMGHDSKHQRIAA